MQNAVDGLLTVIRFLRLHSENFQYIMLKSFAYRVGYVSVGELVCGE